ncbi:class I SAM-dependent methyltransferase [Pararhodonellum marinum]|uniref:class I SAM-dependent methyltransferase n=1 Tax=Pararhodonellum marinum TaxID=2755358 RepID=UPI0018909019|nr:class I SAM-dependent methyltransferase [Pararhodonellum marinum]
MKKTIKNVIMTLGLPITFLSASWMKFIVKGKPFSPNDRIFMKVGVLPVLDHYYQPLVNPKKHLKNPLNEARNLPGIDWNEKAQLELLNSFDQAVELDQFPLEKQKDFGYYYNNGMYESGDAEYFYSLIRTIKPRKIIEIGSGHSTLMAINAIKANKHEDPNYTCKHICIEPYEQPWLSTLDIELIRKRVEDIPTEQFKILEENDILFIDSSHIIRPQGDVLYEFLEIIPSLNSGVFVHIHDILSPNDYLQKWVIEEHRLWNEQYLLEAFLSFNSDFEIVGALNYLMHKHKELVYEKFPKLKLQKPEERGAFWIRRK